MKGPSLIITHPNLVDFWHPTKNGDLTPDDVTSGSGLKVWWKCPKTCPYGCPHDYKQIIRSKIISNDCPYCSHAPSRPICFHESIQFLHPDVAKEFHPTKIEI